MKLATWNVNSLSVRLPQVLDWLASASPDVLVLQETKLTDDKFPVAELTAAGWQCTWFGQKTYNGVALLARGEAATDVDPQPFAVLERANGICQRCRNNAPFLRDSDGLPYLEVHHKTPLAEGGLDMVENAIALCPNCHRHAHLGKRTF